MRWQLATATARSTINALESLGGHAVAEWGYEDEWGATYDPWYPEVQSTSQPDFYSSPAYQQFTGWGDPTGVGSSGDTSFSGEGSGLLGGLGGLGCRRRLPGTERWHARPAPLRRRLDCRGRHRDQRRQRSGTTPGGGAEPGH